MNSSCQTCGVLAVLARVAEERKRAAPASAWLEFSVNCSTSTRPHTSQTRSNRHCLKSPTSHGRHAALPVFLGAAHSRNPSDNSEYHCRVSLVLRPLFASLIVGADVNGIMICQNLWQVASTMSLPVVLLLLCLSLL